MTSLTRLSLANRLIAGLVTLAIVVFGVLATLNLKQELLPSIQVPTAIVTANYPGVSPQIVADEVSNPLESALTGVSGVTKVQSSSTNGLATITVEWEYGLDADTVVGDIRNAVDGIAPTLPDQVETEVITGSTDDIPVLLLAVASDAPLDEAGRQVENVAVPDLSGIDGVRSVTVTGQETTQLLVTLRPPDLRKHDVTAQAVTQAVQGQATITPAGSSFDKDLELAVEVGTSTNTVKQFQALQVPTPDGPVALSAVADVKVDSIESTSIARADGRPALSVAVLKDTDADAVDITHSVRARKIVTVEGLRGPGGELHPVQQAFVDELAPQCGFCTPGQVISAVALLKHNPKPSREEARMAMSGNLCRCGAYDNYLNAVMRAAGG